jgi:hypothetical protein
MIFIVAIARLPGKARASPNRACASDFRGHETGATWLHTFPK